MFRNIFKKNLIFCLIFCSNILFCEKLDKVNKENWTWCYKKVFTDLECEKNSLLDGVSFFKENTKYFSQLIFSFNAARPKNGGFIFYIQSRTASNKKWSQWHKMFFWGSKFQTSYYSARKSDNNLRFSVKSVNNSSVDASPKYVHVRLETGQSGPADAFKVVIKPYPGVNGGADLGLIKSVCACISDFGKFSSEIINGEIIDDKLLNLKSVHIKGVPKISQRLVEHARNAHICSPTSCSMLAGYFNKFYIDPLVFVNNVFDPGLGKNGSYGNWCFNVAELYCKCNGKILFYVTRMNGFADLHEKLLEGCPVIVSVRGRLEGGQKEYAEGHLIVVVGFDCSDSTVICHDPAFYTDESTYIKYKLETFLRGWENSNRLAYVANFKN